MKVKFFSFIGLLISFAAIFIVLPLSADYVLLGFITQVIFTVIIFFSVYAVAENKTTFVIALLLAVPSVLIHWIESLDNSSLLQVIDIIFSIILYCYISYILLLYIFHKTAVTLNVIYGAISVYGYTCITTVKLSHSYLNT